MTLYPATRSTTSEKLPDVSAAVTCSSCSEITSRVELAVVWPETTTVSVFKRVSSSGEEMVSWLLVTSLFGAGEEAAVGEGVGEIPAWGRFFRLLLAVQMPKVMTSPSAKPMAMAKITSFFI